MTHNDNNSPTGNTRTKVLELYRLGYKDYEIARAVGVTYQRVQQLRAKLRLPSSRAMRGIYAKVCFCGDKARVKGLCQKHYNNMRNSGDPFGLGGPMTPQEAKERTRFLRIQQYNQSVAVSSGFIRACLLCENPTAKWGRWNRDRNMSGLSDGFKRGMELAEIYLSIGQPKYDSLPPRHSPGRK